jgi:hypothetical protein
VPTSNSLRLHVSCSVTATFGKGLVISLMDGTSANKARKFVGGLDIDRQLDLSELSSTGGRCVYRLSAAIMHTEKVMADTSLCHDQYCMVWS